MKWLQVRNFTLWVVVLLLCACIDPGRIAPASPSLLLGETRLGTYRKAEIGGFSHRWLAYILYPEKGADDQNIYVELNGKQLGPYSGISERVEISNDGNHIAFAARKGDQWVIVVDGEEKWQHAGLGWAWYFWTLNLEGNMFAPESQAAIMQFSSSGKTLAYMAGFADEQWGMLVNGKFDQTFPSVGINVQFVGEQAIYWAGDDTEKRVFYGDQILGHYSEVWGIKLSADSKHFVFGAKQNDQMLLVVDGQTHKIAGEVAAYELSTTGVLVYAYQTDDGIKVNFAGGDLPDEYDEVVHLTISPDEQHIAFWGRQGDSWSVVTDTQSYPGFDGHFYRQANGEIYAIMWGADSTNLAYVANKGEGSTIALNGHELPADLRQVFPVDRQAFVQCLLVQEQAKCEPATVTLLGNTLAYKESNGEQIYMVIGARQEGPYQAIESSLLTATDGSHYAYVVRTEQGLQIVLDGQLMNLAYEAIYRPQFLDNAEFAHLGVRAGDMFRASYPLSGR